MSLHESARGMHVPVKQWCARPSGGNGLARLLSHRGASFSGRDASSVVCQSLLGTHTLDPSKLRVAFHPSVTATGPQLPAPRRYTLTHSDITGQLQLSVGQDFNKSQLSGWYLQFIRDEVLAEWSFSEDDRPELHLFCHISGNGSAPIPPGLRSAIFQREMPLVLRAIKFADRRFLAEERGLLAAAVYVNLSSHVKALNMQVEWGVLGDEQTWRRPAAAWYELWWERLLRKNAARSAQPELPAEDLVIKAAMVKSGGASAQAQGLVYSSRNDLTATRQALETLVASTEGPQRPEAELQRAPVDASCKGEREKEVVMVADTPKCGPRRECGNAVSSAALLRKSGRVFDYK